MLIRRDGRRSRWHGLEATVQVHHRRFGGRVLSSGQLGPAPSSTRRREAHPARSRSTSPSSAGARACCAAVARCIHQPSFEREARRGGGPHGWRRRLGRGHVVGMEPDGLLAPGQAVSGARERGAAPLRIVDALLQEVPTTGDGVGGGLRTWGRGTINPLYHGLGPLEDEPIVSVMREERETNPDVRVAVFSDGTDVGSTQLPPWSPRRGPTR